MSSRTKKIIGAVTAIVILLILLLLWRLFGQQPVTTVVNTANAPVNNAPVGILNTGGTAKPRTVDATAPAPAVTEKADPRTNLLRLASAFAERYGSYSNQGDYENLEELRALMTDSFAAKTRDFVARSRAAGSTGADYVGYTTKSLTPTIVMFSEEDGRATVKINTQRQEVTAQGTRVFYQELELKFIREGEIWKADSAVWAEQGG